MALVTEHWQNLSNEQRKAWYSMAINYKRQNGLGKTYTPSGYHLHNSLNMNMITFGYDFLDVPLMPIRVNSKPIDRLTFGGSVSGLALRFSSFGGFPARVALFATAPQSTGKNFVKSEFRLLFTTGGVNGNTIIFQSQYVAKFGVPPSGSKVFAFLRWFMPSTGQTVTGNKASIIIP